ncbi:MAG: glycosyltransferase family 39 protein, partial [Planctomycetaceae bacterium]|nr:glycosyltransferase family 39 protein [Planctomycetaceae bacterium]
ILWIVLPALFLSGYRPDVIELQLIGKEWVLATRKHPMLPAWILEILNILTNRAFAAPFIASQLCVLLTLWSVWKLGRTVLSEKHALIGTLVMLPYWFFTIESIKYNQNLVLIAFWSLSVYLVFQALQTNRLFYWLMSGLSIGLAFHAKYTTIILVLTIIIYMIIRPSMRKYFWNGIGFYCTALIAFLVFLPHLIWLYEDNFAIFNYLHNRHYVELTWFNYFICPLHFFATQLLFLLPILIVLFPTVGYVWNWKFKEPEKNKEMECEKYIFFCIMIPFGIHLIISCITRMSLLGDYGAVFWTFFGIWILLRFQSREIPNLFLRTIKFLVFMEVIGVFIFIFQSVFSPYITGTPRNFHYPMRELGASCNRIWDSRFLTPCPYITGDWFLAGNAAYTMKDRPTVHFYWDNIYNLNAKPTGIWSEDSDINKNGGMILWDVADFSDNEMPPYVRQRFPKAEKILDNLILPYKTKAKVPPLRVGVAIVPPQ